MAAIDTTSINFRFARLMLGKSSRIRIYRQIKSMVQNSIPVKDALEQIWNRASNGGRKKDHPEAIMARLWIQRMANGSTFAQSIKDCVPGDEAMLIEAGETGGSFVKALADVIDLLQKRGKIKGALFAGLSYPIFLTLALLGMLGVFGLVVIPPFAMVLPVEKWTGIGASLAVLSTLVRGGAIPVGIVIVGSIVAYFATVKHWSGTVRTRFDRMPPWSIYRMFVGAGFMMSLSALIRADVPVQKALERLREDASPYLRTRITAALRYVNNGADIGDAFFTAGHDFPDREIVSDLRIYAKMTNFSEMLETISKEWVDQAVIRIEAQCQVLKNVMLFLLATVIMWAFIGIWSITNQISEAAMLNI